MTDKIGFMQCVVARNKKYYYLRRGFRDKKNNVKKESIYNFGRKEQAIALINEWIEDPNKIPENMKKYDSEDFRKWIGYIEDKENL